METKLNEKLGKINFDNLPVFEQVKYIEQAEYLISKGYVNGNAYDVAKNIYDKRRA